MANPGGMVTNRFGLIIEAAGSTSRHIDATPGTVLDAITCVRRLPEWNAAIESVIEDPGPLGPQSQWVVMMHPDGWPRWRSRSTVDEIDRDAGLLSYTTQTDDGNASFATWNWQVAPAATGSELTVAWQLYPKTLGRRTIIGRLRQTMLAREVDASLRQLVAMLHLEDPTGD